MMKQLGLCLAALLCVAGCTRPAAVRNVATNAQPLVASLQRGALASGQNMAIQRRDLQRRTAQFEAIRRDQLGLTAVYTGAWEDAGRQEDVERLERLSAGEDEIRAEPFAHLRPAAPPQLATVRIQTEGLTTIAQALDRLKGEQGLTARDLWGFASEVLEEARKVEEERAEQAPAAQPQP
jgi:hypothetical protein